MRICSLLPGATEVVAALGLVDDLVAISHECDYPPEIRHKPVIIRSAVDPRKTSSPAIDRQVRDALKNGRSEEHTSELQSQSNLVCRLLLEKKKKSRHSR